LFRVISLVHHQAFYARKTTKNVNLSTFVVMWEPQRTPNQCTSVTLLLHFLAVLLVSKAAPTTNNNSNNKADEAFPLCVITISFIFSSSYHFVSSSSLHHGILYVCHLPTQITRCNRRAIVYSRDRQRPAFV